MIFLKRRRLIGWLIKAYLKRWGKTILFSFLIGLVVFGILFSNRSFFLSKIPISNTTGIGIVGAYQPDNLPPVILDKISKGLTYASSDGKIHPAAASSWEIKDNGKVYIFHLNQNIKFSDGKKLTSTLINYDFSDAKIDRPNPSTVVFTLKDNYSPFLLTVSNRKIFKDNLVGIGDFKVDDLKLNGDLVQSVEISSVSNSNLRYNFKFFDDQSTMKTAFVLGEIDQMDDINDLNYKDTSLDKFKNLDLERHTNYQKLVTIFYNNQDADLSDKRIRKALSYAVPNDFAEGQKNFTPYNPSLWATEAIANPYEQDFTHSELLLKQVASGSAKFHFTIKTLPQYRKLADNISESWKRIGVTTSIEEVLTVPSSFQIFLGDFPVLKDPDQYSLWHTNQPSNISNYRNLRIDKLLEDGRKTVSQQERKKIYADFQKYLLDDAPASFLFFPYTYTVKRK